MSADIGNTNASKRRQLAQEALRLRIEGERHIDELNEIDQALSVPDADVARLKARADIKFGLLKKVLPDLRATELTGEGGGPVKGSVEIFFKE